MQIDEKLDQKVFHQFFVKLNAFCSDSVLFDEYKLTIDYNYREIQSRTRLLGTVDDFNDFDKLIEEYNNNHIEGWAKFIVNIIFKKPMKCSLNLFRKTISDI